MKNSALNLIFKTALKQRERDIVACFAALENDVASGKPNPGSCRPTVLGLCKCLETLGGGFSVFGHYLSSRADLFSVQDCFAFAKINDVAPETPIEDVRRAFKKEMGRRFEECYAVFDDVPFESRTLYQLHRGQLHSGRDVTVKVLHPHVSERIESDRDALRQGHRMFAYLGWTDDLVGAVLGHFDSMLLQQMDVMREADALKGLEQEIQNPDLCRGPALYPALCSASILTTERLPGWRLDNFVTQLQDDKQMPPLIGTKEFQRELARHFCSAFLHQVFNRRLFPVTPYAEHLFVLPDGSVAFTGGRFARLPADAHENLWEYQIAALEHDPDRACRSLLREMDAQKGASDPQTLSHLFRQVVPFRDGGWGEIGHRDTLSEHLFIHWQLAVQHGYRPRPWLLDFFRGLFLITAAAHQLAPDADPLKEALASHRDQLGRDQFQHAFDMGRWSDALDKYAASFSELPQKLDQLLNHANDSDFKLKFRVKEAPEHRRERNTSALAVSLLLLLVSIALMTYYLSAMGNGAWVKQVGAVVFVVVGGVLLWVLTRLKI